MKSIYKPYMGIITLRVNQGLPRKEQHHVVLAENHLDALNKIEEYAKATFPNMERVHINETIE